MDCQAETAFKASDMVLEEVGVFVEVDCLEGELAKTLATVCVRCGVRCNTTATELGPCAVLKEVRSCQRKWIYMLLVLTW